MTLWSASIDLHQATAAVVAKTLRALESVREGEMTDGELSLDPSG
jgi:hypothetical protein